MSVHVILGGTRGIGFSLAKALLETKRASRVVVTGRTKPHDVPAGVEFVPLDFSHGDSIAAGSRAVLAATEGRFDALFVVGAVLLPAKSWATTSTDDMRDSFQTNVTGPLQAVQMLIGGLEKGSEKLLFLVSSMMASIGDNTSGGHLPYRSSKAAFNMLFKNLSIELPHLRVLLYHPGMVATDMLANAKGHANAAEAGEKDEAFFKNKTADTSARELIAIAFDEKKQSGHFYDYSGKELPW